MSVHDTPAGTYEVRWRVPHPLERGRWIQKQKTFEKHKAATDYDKKVHTQVAEGDYVPETSLTMKEISEKWLEAKKFPCLRPVRITYSELSGELNEVRWNVVNLKKGTLFVHRSLTQLKGGPELERSKKKNAYRTLKMAPELVSELRRWKLQCPQSGLFSVMSQESR